MHLCSTRQTDELSTTGMKCFPVVFIVIEKSEALCLCTGMSVRGSDSSYSNNSWEPKWNGWTVNWILCCSLHFIVITQDGSEPSLHLLHIHLFPAGIVLHLQMRCAQRPQVQLLFGKRPAAYQLSLAGV